MTKPVTTPTRSAPFTVGSDGAGGSYRLARQYKNIALQRLQPGGRWRTIAYCGNNPRSVTRAVTELATAHWSPADGQDLGRQLDDLRRAIVRLERTIREGYYKWIMPLKK
ncbi:MAG: hypothetical protein ACYTEQ_30370 [Planctomycetota bacterium]|jgi:hypothetical protein